MSASAPRHHPTNVGVFAEAYSREHAPVEKVYEFYIRTTPERLWEALTDSEIRTKYNFGNRITSDWRPGSHYELTHPGAPGPIGEGEVLEVDAPHRLVQTMVALWSEDVKGEGSSRLTWEIEQVADSCRLLLTHDQLREGPTSSCTAAGRWCFRA